MRPALWTAGDGAQGTVTGNGKATAGVQSKAHPVQSGATSPPTTAIQAPGAAVRSAEREVMS
jgi:hypothetical protein